MLRQLVAIGVLFGVPAAASAQEANFRCPEHGTRVERTAGPTLAYRGADANSPLLCLDQIGEARFLGYWRASDAFYRNGGDALTQAFMEAGTEPSRPVRIKYFTTSSLTRDSIMVWETWQMLGRERVDVPAGSFDATKVQREFWVMSSTYRFAETVWFDRATGTPVKSMVEHLNFFMSPDVINWQAVDVQRRRPGA
jgi:hypothetical protein